MVRVKTTVFGVMLPTAMVLPEHETAVAVPPLTDSVQLMKANFVKSPDETRVELA